jgi:hypothetical protein
MGLYILNLPEVSEPLQVIGGFTEPAEDFSDIEKSSKFS